MLLISVSILHFIIISIPPDLSDKRHLLVAYRPLRVHLRVHVVNHLNEANCAIIKRLAW